MAAVSTSRRSIAGIALVVAGALLLLDAVLDLAAGSAPGNWLVAIAYLAIAVAFLILAIASFRNTIARIALIVAAVGWLLLALGYLVVVPAPLGMLAAIAAAVGGVVAAIVLYVGKEVVDVSAIAFIVTTIVAALILLAGVAGFALGTFGTILWIVFGVGLVVTGVLFARTHGSRGR